MVHSLWKAVSNEVKVHLLYDSAVPLLDICPKQMKTYYDKNACTGMFLPTLVVITKSLLQPKCPSMEE